MQIYPFQPNFKLETRNAFYLYLLCESVFSVYRILVSLDIVTSVFLLPTYNPCQCRAYVWEYRVYTYAARSSKIYKNPCNKSLRDQWIACCKTYQLTPPNVWMLENVHFACCFMYIAGMHVVRVWFFLWDSWTL